MGLYNSIRPTLALLYFYDAIRCWLCILFVYIDSMHWTPILSIRSLAQSSPVKVWVTLEPLQQCSLEDLWVDCLEEARRESSRRMQKMCSLSPTNGPDLNFVLVGCPDCHVFLVLLVCSGCLHTLASLEDSSNSSLPQDRNVQEETPWRSIEMLTMVVAWCRVHADACHN